MPDVTVTFILTPEQKHSWMAEQHFVMANALLRIPGILTYTVGVHCLVQFIFHFISSVRLGLVKPLF
jgi:UPF0716 family protein affecting phage T7 exclusion